MSSMALAGESRLMVHDVKGDAAALSPREVIIHTSTDIEGIELRGRECDRDADACL